MNPHRPAVTQTLQLSLSPATGVEFLNAAAAVLRTVPFVERVRIDATRSELEVVCRQPVPSLLRQIHQALQLVRSERTIERAA